MPFDNVAAYENQSPTLLAEQPPVSDTKAPTSEDWGQIFVHLESRLGMMRTWRYSWWAYWAQLAEYVLPERYHWLVTANTMNRGNPINQSIVDSTATLAMQICAAGLWTGLTSPSRPWFALDIALPWLELDEDGRDWLEDTEQKIYTVLAQSNFYTVMAQAFKDVAVFGTAPVIIYEDAEDVIRCFLPCAGEYYLAVGSRLSVDTLYREFTFTVAQIVEMFKLENCPHVVRDRWSEGGGSLELEFVVAHAIEPNFAIDKRGATKGKIDVVPGGFTFREVYWLKGQKTGAELSRRGFHERPFMAARWSVTSNNPYGRSPGMDALGDTKQLQMETRRKAEFIEKLVRPPMGGNPELKNEPSSILPGNITYTNTAGGAKGFWPIFEVKPEALAPMIQDIEKIEQRIDRAYFVDIFMAISRMEGVQPRNQLELTKRDLERLQVLGPFIELFETECAGPTIQRVLAILERRRMLKPMPRSLQGVPLKIEYTSIMKLAQQAAETAAMEGFFAVAGNLSAGAKEAGLPDPLRTVNLDKALKRYAERTNFPKDLFFTDREVQQQDKARMAQAQQFTAAKSAGAAVSAAKTLSETNIGGGNTALSAMLGQGSPGAGVGA